MEKFDLNQTIGESVTQHPELVKVYMDYDVDFCCGGDRTVKEAIEKDTNQVDQLIVDAEAALNQRQKTDDGAKEIALSDMTNEQLITHITKEYHNYLKKELPVILDLMLKVLTVHGENHPELFKIQTVFGTLKTGLEGHLIREEVTLFPKLRKGNTDCKPLVERLEKEHDGAGDALHKLTELTDHFKLPADACTSYGLLYQKLKEFVANMYMHVHTENNVLFKRAV